MLFVLQSGARSATPAESAHIDGPDGLVGWTLTHLLENQDEVSDTLVIARNGKVIRTLKGDPFIWQWRFLDGGKTIAFESGPLHFVMVCVLVDTSTGKELQREDCYSYPETPPPGGWPEWLMQLEATH